MVNSNGQTLMKYKVAGINYDPTMFMKEKNVNDLLEMTEEAAKNDAKLIALPEMGTTGYCWYRREEIRNEVEPIPGPTTEKFSKIAKEYDCYIVVGMPEVDEKTDLYYNSAVLIGPEGVIGVHRKSHLYISEPKWAKQGDVGHQVFETPIGNLGMLICMDIHFVETARLEGLGNADVIIHLSNWLAEKTPAPYWLTRGFENGCYVLESNRCGLERTVQASGGSVLINPDGTINSYVDDGNQIMYGEVDLEQARKKDFDGTGNKFLERRPDEYKELLQDPYLWNPLEFFGLYGYDPLPKGKKSNITVAQSQFSLGDIEKNLQKIKALAEDAADRQSELIVFPELSLCGLIDKEEAKNVAIEAPGKIIDDLIDISMKNSIYMVVGFVEKESENLYNTAALIGPEGLVGKYRKIHLDERDREWATPGNLGFQYFNIPVGRVGILIGHDAMFPESGRILALKGVDLICCPSAVTHPEPYGLGATEADHNYPIPRGYSPIHWHLWRVRGGENNCYLAFANAVGEAADGKKLIGRSGIFGPDTFAFPRTEVILSKEREEVGALTIDTSNKEGSVYPTNVVRRKDLVLMRQPLWYDLLIDKNPPVLEK